MSRTYPAIGVKDMATVTIATQNPLRTKRRFFKLSLGLALLLIAGIAIGLGVYREYGEIVTYNHLVADLLPTKGSGADPTQNAFNISTANAKARDQIIVQIMTSIQPDSWASRGGRGTITPFFLSSSLIVRNNRAAQRQIARMLDRRRAELAVNP